MDSSPMQLYAAYRLEGATGVGQLRDGHSHRCRVGGGALIGYERSYRGRPAGFRTHALVCMASSMLMLITVYEAHWVRAADETVRLDPTRMAQGIMTGIGFLGAGVIMQEGSFGTRPNHGGSSIWITAAIGILAGIGFYFPMALSVVLGRGSSCLHSDGLRHACRLRLTTISKFVSQAMGTLMRADPRASGAAWVQHRKFQLPTGR